MNIQNELEKCLLTYSGGDVMVGNAISPQKLSNATTSFPIDTRDTILALIDTTVMGSCKNGLAIGLKGIYWNNDWTTKTAKKFLSWDELFQNQKDNLFFVKSYDLNFGHGNAVNLSGSRVKPQTLHNLLNQVISIYADAKQQAESSVIQSVQTKEISQNMALTDTTLDESIAKLCAIIICSDGEVEEKEIDLGVELIEACDDVSDKVKTIECLTETIETLLVDYQKSKSIFKLKVSKIILQETAKISKNPSYVDATKIILDALSEQSDDSNGLKHESHEKIKLNLASL